MIGQLFGMTYNWSTEFGRILEGVQIGTSGGKRSFTFPFLGKKKKKTYNATKDTTCTAVEFIAEALGLPEPSLKALKESYDSLVRQDVLSETSSDTLSTAPSRSSSIEDYGDLREEIGMLKGSLRAAETKIRKLRRRNKTLKAASSLLHLLQESKHLVEC